MHLKFQDALSLISLEGLASIIYFCFILIMVLLHLAQDLDQRFLPAFQIPTSLQYVWTNLKVDSLKDTILSIY
jgi:hypothetical protein